MVMKKLAFILAISLVPMGTALSASKTVKVEGKSYAPTINLEGKTLKLVGAGLREKWFFDVYTMGVYSESGKCDAKDLIDTDQVKYLRLDMLRDVSAEKMSSTLAESFGKHMPNGASPKLKEQVKTFKGYFKDECKEGVVLEMYYVPGKGTIIKQDGKQLGPPLEGKDFGRILFDIYFGKNTCCDDLIEQIMKTCKG
ncbi:MAG: hypothetical protein GXP49_06800 [Deltaproteobacteria bacterium]|nr:hypothetical protein [Deltaproteobacteria bacterium]